MYSTKTVSSQTTSPWIPLDDNQAAFSATVAVAVSGTLTYTVEFTLDNIQDPAVTPVAFPIGLVGETASNTTFIKSPVKAIRLNVTAFTSGSATIGVRQGTDNVWGYPDSTDFAEAFSTTPKTVLSVGVPFVLPAGDGSAVGLFFTNSAGNFTLTAGAILTNVWNALKGCWMYLPANFGGRTYPAGWYWAVFSSDTAGILYTDTYTSGKPIRPASPTAFPTNLSGWLTTTTSEITGPTGFVLPGGSMGKSGCLKTHLRTVGNVTANKTFRLYAGATVISLVGSITTSPNFEALISTRNQGSESLQCNSRQAALTGVGIAGTSFIAGTENSSVETSVDQTLSISLQISTTSACAVLLHADITCTYGA